MILVDSDSQPASVRDEKRGTNMGQYADGVQAVDHNLIHFGTHPFGTVQIRFSSILFNEKYFVKRIREVCLKEVCEKVWGKKWEGKPGGYHHARKTLR